MRGKLGTVDVLVNDGRIIPARAGQTSRCRTSTSRRPDHPRACGANHACMALMVLPVGSSPRVRGKQRGLDRAPPVVRIIPARAGQTRQRHKPTFLDPDHPRACGANATARSGGADHHRIIPARAGQTGAADTGHVAGTDHPRACGANSPVSWACSPQCGSSPRVRGKPVPPTARPLGSRIIPARAGQTTTCSPTTSADSDHPRACGANRSALAAMTDNHGSSPRVRGKRPQKRHEPTQNRIIPARAGQTSSRACDGSARSDHPRACGANSSAYLRAAFVAGSSPRVRGKLMCSRLAMTACRIIPARAGQTRLQSGFTYPTPDHPRACGANR